MYSCLLYPIGLQEVEFEEIEKVTQIQINHMVLNRDYNFAADLDFFKIDISYNSLELQFAIFETIFLLDIMLNFFIIRTEET